MENKICEWCGRPFKPVRGDARFCSKSCKRRSHYRYKEKPLREPSKTKVVACKMCGKEFETYKLIGITRKQFCSRECMKRWGSDVHNSHVMRSSFPGISSASVGAINELVVSVDLMKRGYDVFRALSPACPCDLIVLSRTGPIRVEVRTGYRTKSGAIYCSKYAKERGCQDVYAIVVEGAITYKPELSGALGDKS